MAPPKKSRYSMLDWLAAFVVFEVAVAFIFGFLGFFGEFSIDYWFLRKPDSLQSSLFIGCITGITAAVFGPVYFWFHKKEIVSDLTKDEDA